MEQLEKILALCHDPMLILEKNHIAAMNAAARAILPGYEVGRNVVGLIPGYVLFNDADSFTATMQLSIWEYTVSCAHVGEYLVLSLQSVHSRSRGLLSENLLTGLNSALFSVDLSSRALTWDKTLSPKSREYLTMLRHGFHTLNRLLSNLNFAIALQEHNVILNPTQTDLVLFCSDLLSEIDSLTSASLASLEFTTTCPTLTASIDRSKFRRLLLNLLSNSFAHCGKDGHIRLRLSSQGQDAVITVSDDGSGIPTETLQNVFTRFEKYVNEKQFDEAFTGGLGLGISRAIAQMHGGAMVIDSTPGKGTNVRVLLPLKQPDTLRDPGVAMENDDLHILLTELSDVLGTEAYQDEFK